MIIIVCEQWLMDIVEEEKNRVFFLISKRSPTKTGVMSARRQMLDSTSENVQKTMSNR